MNPANYSPSPRRRLVLLGWALIPICTLLPLGAFWLFSQPTNEHPPRQVHIPQGASAHWIGEFLERENLVQSARIFAWTVRLKGLGHQLEAGTYELDGTRTTGGIIQNLLKAPIQTRRATIPEGLTRYEIAAHLHHEGLVDSTRFIAATEDPHLIRALGIEAESLEGYLFPETYFLDMKTDERAIVEFMVDQFRSVFADSLLERLSSLDLSLDIETYEFSWQMVPPMPKPWFAAI